MWLIQRTAPDSREAHRARASKRYPSELRRLIKRHEAISSLSPYLVAIVAVAENWIYENGVLCHIHDRELRILDLHGSQSEEIVVDIRHMLDEAIPESRQSRKYTFQPLYFAHGVVSCLYRHTRPTHGNWLVVFNAYEQRILTARPIESTLKIFVRNNERFLCYGVWSSVGRDEGRRWALGAYEMSTNTWLGHEIDLPEPIGSDIGSTVCFEIFGSYFYGVSSQTSLDDEVDDWMSYYTCFRFPLVPGVLQSIEHNIEHAPRRQLWRRCHFEGPIDDRWSFLRLIRDEATSELKVVESRKEWLARTSSARRTYYTTKVEFRPPLEQGSLYHNSPISVVSSPGGACKTNEPDFITAPPRDPDLAHPGDDNSDALMFSPSKSPVRAYHSVCQTFMDLVDDPSVCDPSKQRIRLRAGRRRRWRASESDERAHLLAKPRQEPLDPFDRKVADMYKHEDVISWPPEQDVSNPDSNLTSLYAVLNPPNHSGLIRGIWDERSILYAVEGNDGFQALVFLSFDPAIYLSGIMSFPSDLMANNPFAQADDAGLPERALPQEQGGVNRWQSASVPNTTSSSHMKGASHNSTRNSGNGPWRTWDRAMYQNIGSIGFHFAL